MEMIGPQNEFPVPITASSDGMAACRIAGRRLRRRHGDGVALHHSQPASGVERYEERTGALPTSQEFERWLIAAKEIERELRKGDARFSLQMKKAHVYPKVLKGEEVIGRFRPEATSTSVRAEITSFNIARGLGCGELFQPAVEIELRGKGLAAFGTCSRQPSSQTTRKTKGGRYYRRSRTARNL